MSKIRVLLVRLVVTAQVYCRWGIAAFALARKNRRVKRRLVNTRGVLSLRIESHVGLFGQLSWCLLIAEFCRQRELIPKIALVGRQYGDNGEDWFPFLFDGAAEGASQLSSHAGEPMFVGHITDLLPSFAALLPVFEESNFNLSMEHAHQLQRRFLPLRKEILDRVDQFVARHFQNAPVIGCHYRGTDKTLEAVRIDYEVMTDAIKVRLAAYPGTVRLFVATDEAAFVEHVRATLPGVHVITADHSRSSDGQPLHEGENLLGRRHAIEALTDCLLLSRCDCLIKSSSLLSAWSKVFNPSLPLTLIGSPKQHMVWYPENTLHGWPARMA